MRLQAAKELIKEAIKLLVEIGIWLWIAYDNLGK